MYGAGSVTEPVLYSLPDVMMYMYTKYWEGSCHGGRDEFGLIILDKSRIVGN